MLVFNAIFPKKSWCYYGYFILLIFSFIEDNVQNYMLYTKYACKICFQKIWGWEMFPLRCLDSTFYGSRFLLAIIFEVFLEGFFLHYSSPFFNHQLFRFKCHDFSILLFGGFFLGYTRNSLRSWFCCILIKIIKVTH